MMSRFGWKLRELLKKVWVRVVGFGVLALVAAGLARLIGPFLNEELVFQTGSNAVESLLEILTSSMLVVTTFSLSIAVSAFAAASDTATPRASVLLQQDGTTQNVLATFLGAFIFGLVGLIAIHAEIYGEAGKVVVFLFTVIVLVLVVVALIRWIAHLMEFGRMNDTLERVEKAALKAMQRRLENPYLGGMPLQDGPPAGCISIDARQTGYVQHINMRGLQDCAEASDIRVYLRHLPGAFVAPGVPLIFTEGAPLDPKQTEALRCAVRIGAMRIFEDDPRFGLIVMTEIASRALSPAVNDPGTAIDILGRHVRILSQWRMREDAEKCFDRVFVPPIKLRDVMEDAFRPIARDGAPLLEVQIRLQKALAILGRSAPDIFEMACSGLSREALSRAEAASLLPWEVSEIRSVCFVDPSFGRATSATEAEASVREI